MMARTAADAEAEGTHRKRWFRQALAWFCGQGLTRGKSNCLRHQIVAGIPKEDKSGSRTSSYPLWKRAGKWLRRRCGPWLGIHDQYAPRPMRLRPAASLPDLMAAPTISIVTPSFNQGNFLERTLLSVLNQKYPALEYIVQDGGSSDQSVEILHRYHSQLYHVAVEPDHGQAHAINLGFRHARGEILAFLNSDDLLLPGTLHCVAEFFQQHPEIDVVYGHRIIIDEKDREIGRWILPPHEDAAFIWNDYIPQETMFWRRSIWERAGGRLAEDYHSALDLELLWRFRQAGARFQRLPRFLGAFRVHPQQKTIVLRQDRGLPEQQRLRKLYHQRSVPNWEARLRVIPYQCKHWISSELYWLGIEQY